MVPCRASLSLIHQGRMFDGCPHSWSNHSPTTPSSLHRALQEAAHGLTTSVAPAIAVRPTGQSAAPLVQPPWSSPSEDTCQQPPEVDMDAQPANEQQPRFTFVSSDQLQAPDAGAASFDTLVQSAQREQQANPGELKVALAGRWWLELAVLWVTC